MTNHTANIHVVDNRIYSAAGLDQVRIEYLSSKFTANTKPCMTTGTIQCRFDMPAEKPWTVPRHIPGFRPLAPSERWHRDDFTKDMLPAGWRPLLDHEDEQHDDQANCAAKRDGFVSVQSLGPKRAGFFVRTRRPLPHTDEWIPWDGGKCPVPSNQLVRIKTQAGNVSSAAAAGPFDWERPEALPNSDIIAFQLVRDAKPEPKTPTLRDRISHATDVLELRDLLLQALPDLGLPQPPAPTLPATAHNPDKLTPEQVGVADGWRLLDEDEIRAGSVTHSIQRWLINPWEDGAWEYGAWEGCDKYNTYRTRLSREELAKLRAGK